MPISSAIIILDFFDSSLAAGHVAASQGGVRSSFAVAFSRSRNPHCKLSVVERSPNGNTLVFSSELFVFSSELCSVWIQYFKTVLEQKAYDQI